MFRLCLIALVLALASAKLAVNVGTSTVSRTTSDCFRKSNNITKVVLELMNVRGTLNSQFLTNYINSLDSGMEMVDAIVRVNDSSVPFIVCNEIVKNLPPGFDGVVWFHIKNDKSFWTKPVDDRVNFLVNLTTTCDQRGLEVGVYSDAAGWAATMGFQSAGNFKLKNLPVWYFNDNTYQNFNDFHYAGFGNWPKPSMKEYSGSTSLCSSYVDGLEYY